MLVVAKFFLLVRAGTGLYVPKIHHAKDKRCIFLHGTQQDSIIKKPESDKPAVTGDWPPYHGRFGVFWPKVMFANAAGIRTVNQLLLLTYP